MGQPAEQAPHACAPCPPDTPSAPDTPGTSAARQAGAPGPSRSFSWLLPRAHPRVWAGVVEIAVLGTVFFLYELGRHAVRARESLAFDGAELVIALQKNLFFPRETTVQELLLRSEALVTAANTYYVVVHFPATVAFLIYLWVRRPAIYGWARTTLVTVTVAALLLHVTFPLAPPRMLPGKGFVDTMAVYGPTAYGEGTASVTNQFAAMPSLHAAWALVVGGVLFLTVRRPWRWLFLLHPVVTVIVIVGTANHYWLDIAGAAVLVWLAVLAQGLWSPLRQRIAAHPVDGSSRNPSPGTL